MRNVENRQTHQSDCLIDKVDRPVDQKVLVDVENFEVEVERQSIVDRQNGCGISENIVEAV